MEDWIWGLEQPCSEFFQSDGKVLVDNEELKMRESRREIEEAVLCNILAVISSKPQVEPDGVFRISL